MKLSRQLLDTDQLQAVLSQLPGWELQDSALVKEYQCTDFATAAGFVTIIATLAEKLDHHPDIRLHSWNKVQLTLTTHSAGGITSYDVYLAQQIEHYAQKLFGAD